VSVTDPATGLRICVEADGRTLEAVTASGALAWRVDVGALTPAPREGATYSVRALRVEGGFVFATLGKSHTVQVKLTSGRANYVGSD
jgi:hypothetical protein